jgi:hypothetical protein
MHAVIRRVEGFPDIPYPPQPYSLTCPQVRKTFEAETNIEAEKLLKLNKINLEIEDENLLGFEEF